MHLSPEERAVVLAILARHLPGREVWAFGSRVHGRRLKPFSDLDLAVIGDTLLTLDQLAGTLAAFSDSPLPFRVDVVDWASSDSRFRQQILAEHAVLTRPGA